MKPPRRFFLVDGTRMVAQGVVWSDNSASIRWLGNKDHVSVVFWPDIEVAIDNAFTPTDDLDPDIQWIDE